MNIIAFLGISLLTISSGHSPMDINSNRPVSIIPGLIVQDTLKEYQALYSGKVWKNLYRRINGDQFLFTDYFLDGSVTVYGRTYKNLKIKYDTFSDEILIPVDLEEIVQLNKEMVDSFSISYENRMYRFEKINDDSLNRKNDFNGYLCVLYKGKSALYIKYNKYISPNITEKSDGEFIETHKVFLVKDKSLYPVLSKNDFINTLNIDKMVIKNYLRNNKLKISKKSPESFIPILRFYDSLSK